MIHFFSLIIYCAFFFLQFVSYNLSIEQIKPNKSNFQAIFVQYGENMALANIFFKIELEKPTTF